MYPGDMDAWVSLRVPGSGSISLEVPMRWIIHLVAPVDNGQVLRGPFEECGYGGTQKSPVTFRWEPLGPGVVYSVRIAGMDCQNNYRETGVAFSTSTADAEVTATLPASREGECYGFHLTAHRDGAPVGMFTTHGERWLGWDYRFRVPD